MKLFSCGQVKYFITGNKDFKLFTLGISLFWEKANYGKMLFQGKNYIDVNICTSSYWDAFNLYNSFYPKFKPILNYDNDYSRESLVIKSPKDIYKYFPENYLSVRVKKTDFSEFIDTLKFKLPKGYKTIWKLGEETLIVK